MFHTPPVFPPGFRCASVNCGLKPQAPDLSVFVADTPCAAAAVFTQNRFPGAPIIVGRDIIKHGCLRGIVVNSKVSNVGTGAAGVAHARRMGVALAAELGCAPEHVLMSSTGVIGKPLPIEKIETGLHGIAAHLVADPLVGARGIMTTDTYAKALSCSVGDATLTIVAKGSGMIEPNMATMLVYIFTDASFSASELDRMLRVAVHNSFNMLSVDADTSTSDSCVIMASATVTSVDAFEFQTALNAACIAMTKMLARDGEGASKLLTAHISGAINEYEARVFAKSIINSPLIKTMAYGADPNIGRILMAIGKCFDCHSEPDRLRVSINGELLFADGTRHDFDEQQVRALLQQNEIDIAVDIGLGKHGATAYGCDFTEGYIKENAAYYSS